MSRYLDRLKTLVISAEKHLPDDLPKPTEGEKHLPDDPPKLTKGAFGGFVSASGRCVSESNKSPEPDEVEIEYRKGLASGGVPEPFLDRWGRLQIQKPMAVSDEVWRRAIDDAGRFLDEWSGLASEFDWAAGDLFDVPRDGGGGGLAWFLKSEAVRALGPEHAVTESGRVFDRVPLGYFGEQNTR